MGRRDTWLWYGIGITGFLALMAYPQRKKPPTSGGSGKPTGIEEGDVIQYIIDPAGRVIVHTSSDVQWGMPKLAEKVLPRFRAMTKTWQELLEESSVDYRVPMSWLNAVMWSESQGDQKAVSKAGALGLMQVMPFHFKPSENPLDPRTNVRRGASLLQSARAKGPDIVQSASIYNAGTPPHGKAPWTNAEWLAAGRKPTQTTRWGFAAEPDYLDHVVAANNSYLSEVGA